MNERAHLDAMPQTAPRAEVDGGGDEREGTAQGRRDGGGTATGAGPRRRRARRGQGRAARARRDDDGALRLGRARGRRGGPRNASASSGASTEFAGYTAPDLVDAVPDAGRAVPRVLDAMMTAPYVWDARAAVAAAAERVRVERRADGVHGLHGAGRLRRRARRGQGRAARARRDDNGALRLGRARGRRGGRGARPRVERVAGGVRDPLIYSATSHVRARARLRHIVLHSSHRPNRCGAIVGGDLGVPSGAPRAPPRGCGAPRTGGASSPGGPGSGRG